MASVADAPRELVIEAKNGPHKGWDTYDLKLEGARFHLLQGIVAAPTFDEAAAHRILDELSSLAGSYGYGAADSYLTDVSGMSDDDIDADPQLCMTRDYLFSNTEDDPYFNEVRVSEKALYAGAATPEAREFLASGTRYRMGNEGHYGIVFDRMITSFERGRDERKDMDASRAATP